MVWISKELIQRLIIKAEVQLSNQLALVFYQKDLKKYNYYFLKVHTIAKICDLTRVPRSFVLEAIAFF